MHGAPARHDRAARLLDFFADRLKVQQREAGVRHDLIDAVFALGGEDDLVRLLRPREGAAGVRRDRGRHQPARRLQARGEHPEEGELDRPQVMSSAEEQGIPQTGEEDPLVLVEEPILEEAVAEMASGTRAPTCRRRRR